jgi:hypothetical protein
VNRLGELREPLRAVSTEAASLGPAFLAMERRADRSDGALMRPGGGLSNVFNRYHRAVEALGSPQLAEALAPALAAALDRLLGWAAPEDGAGPVLRVEVEELVVLAADPSASVVVRWSLWAELRDARGEVLWRDCLEVERGVPGLSLERLGVADDEERGRVQAALAREMAAAVAERLREAVRPAAGGSTKEGGR